MVYMIDRYVVGGFTVYANRGIDENLNAPGASLCPLACRDQVCPSWWPAGHERAQPGFT